jgi:hypothetical protein
MFRQHGDEGEWCSLFKTCPFRYQISQNMLFDITFCTGSGRRTHALQNAKNIYGAVASPVDTLFLFRQCFVSGMVYLQLNKKKAKTEGKNCHAKTMWSQEKPISLYGKHPTCAA